MSKPIEKAARNIASIDATRAGSIKALYPPHGGIHELVRSEMDVVRRDDRGSADGDLVPMGLSAGSSGAAAGAGPLSEVIAGLRIQESRRQRTGARAGIFYYKCWFCHNEFTKDIPKLPGLYQRPALISGEPVNDDTVKAKIRDGGPGMAAYKYALSEPDLNDLVSYLREKCCWNSDSPPPNPHYRVR